MHEVGEWQRIANGGMCYVFKAGMQRKSRGFDSLLGEVADVYTVHLARKLER
jgi:hypothetical protein